MIERLKPYFPLLVLILLCIAIGIVAPRFLSLANFVRIASSAAVPLILVCGMTFIILMGSIDLSLEGTLAVAAVTIAHVGLNLGGSPWILLAFPLVVLVGAVVGFCNGAVHVGLRVPSLLTSLGFGFAGLGFATLFAAGGSITIDDPLIRAAAFRRFFGLPVSVWIAMAALLVALYVQEYTRRGNAGQLCGVFAAA